MRSTSQTLPPFLGIDPWRIQNTRHEGHVTNLAMRPDPTDNCNIPDFQGRRSNSRNSSFAQAHFCLQHIAEAEFLVRRQMAAPENRNYAREGFSEASSCRGSFDSLKLLKLLKPSRQRKLSVSGFPWLRIDFGRHALGHKYESKDTCPTHFQT